MTDEDFFGRPRSTATLPSRAPAGRTPSRPTRPVVRERARDRERTRVRSTAPAGGRRPSTSPQPPRRAPRPPARPIARAARSGPPPLTGAQLRTRTLRRLIAFVVAMIIIVALIGVRLVNVQVLGSEQYTAYGATQLDGERPIPASRGAIYDRNGQAFAMSVAQPQVIVDPLIVEDAEGAAVALAEILDEVDPDEIRADLTADARYRVVAKGITPDQAEAIRSLQEAGELQGVTLQDEYTRNRPSGDLGLGVVGHALADGQSDDDGNTGGIAGIEKAWNDQLTGTPGRIAYEQNVWQQPIAGGEQHVTEAKQGTDLYLTLDQSLQYETERTLADTVVETGADSAMAVIMRPSTGEILSMASVAATGDGTVANTRDNRPVTAVFEPGSTNKMITVAGALEEGVVRPDTVIDVPDHLQIYDREFTDSHPHPPAAWSVTDILVTSSNVGSIKIAQQLGPAKVDEYLRAFGFGETTGLGFPNEEDGIMRSLEDWSGVDIGSMPIGQGISVTALQMLAAYNVVANDGVYVAPKLVGATDLGSGQVPTEPSQARRVISAETAAAMRVMLSKVVSEGTGLKAAVPGYEPAGKTGTAWIAQDGGDEEDGYLGADGGRRYQASFVGLVNDADLSIIVTVEDPKTAVYGSDVAAPVFSHLAATALRRYQVPPPALLDASSVSVPELSASARQVDTEDVTGDAPAAAG